MCATVHIITINVPLFKKMWDKMVFCGTIIFSYFKGLFEGSKKSRPPQKVPRNSSKIIVTKNHYVTNFLKQWNIGNFMSFCNHGLSIL